LTTFHAGTKGVGGEEAKRSHRKMPRAVEDSHFWNTAAAAATTTRTAAAATFFYV